MLIILLSSWHTVKLFLDFSIVIMLKVDRILWSIDNVSSMFLSFSYSFKHFYLCGLNWYILFNMLKTMFTHLHYNILMLTHRVTVFLYSYRPFVNFQGPINDCVLF